MNVQVWMDYVNLHLVLESYDCDDDNLIGTVEGGLQVIWDRMMEVEGGCLNYGTWLITQRDYPVFTDSPKAQKVFLDTWANCGHWELNTEYVFYSLIWSLLEPMLRIYKGRWL